MTSKYLSSFLLLKLYSPNFPFFDSEEFGFRSWEFFVWLFIILLVIFVKIGAVYSAEGIRIYVCFIGDTEIGSTSKLRSIIKIVSMNDSFWRLPQAEVIIVWKGKYKWAWSLIRGFFPILQCPPWYWSVATHYLIKLCLAYRQRERNIVTLQMKQLNVKHVIRCSVQKLNRFYL